MLVTSQRHNNQSRPCWLHPFAGGVSGLMMEGILHPLDTVRTRMKTDCARFTSLIGQVKYMYAKEGIKSYLRGFSCTFLGSFVGNAIYFYTYEYCKILLKASNSISGQISPFIAGFLAGFACNTICLPLDVIKARMQIEDTFYGYRNVFDGMTKMCKNEGFSTVIQSCGPVYFALSGLQTGLTFGFYEMSKKGFKHLFKNESQSEINIPLSIASSISAASLAAILVNPLDVLVTRKQTISQNISTVNLMESIFINEGPKGFMKGVSGSVFYHALASAILFPTYEFLKTVFHIHLSDDNMCK